jgi:hypothetical protein
MSIPAGEARMIPHDVHVQISSLLFEGVDQIDLTGPFEVLSRIPNSTYRLDGGWGGAFVDSSPSRRRVPPFIRLRWRTALRCRRLAERAARDDT